MKNKMITITEKEYEELTCYKEMFLDAMMIKKTVVLLVLPALRAYCLF